MRHSALKREEVTFSADTPSPTPTNLPSWDLIQQIITVINRHINKINIMEYRMYFRFLIKRNLSWALVCFGSLCKPLCFICFYFWNISCAGGQCLLYHVFSKIKLANWRSFTCEYYFKEIFKRLKETEFE